MLSYEKCLELKEAGFPQRTQDRYYAYSKNGIIMPNMSAARIINSATNVHVVS